MATNAIVFNAISGSSYIQIDGTKYPTVNMNDSTKQDKIETTDGSTATGYRDYAFTRKEVTFTADLVASTSNYKLPVSSSLVSITLNYASGVALTGSGSLESVDIKGSTDQYIQVSIAGTFVGAVSQS